VFQGSGKSSFVLGKQFPYLALNYLLAGPCWLVKLSWKSDDCGMELSM
jgi:hypothetical protein